MSIGPAELAGRYVAELTPEEREKLRQFYWPRLPGTVAPTVAQDRRSLIGDALEASGETIRQRISSPEFVEALLQGWLPMLKRGDRSARRDLLDVARLTGAGDRLAEALMQALGVASMAVAKQAIEVQRDAGSLASDPDAMRDRAESYLAREYGANPALLERSKLAPLFALRVSTGGEGPVGHGGEGR